MKAKGIIKIIEQDGWFMVRIKGSHRQYKHHNKKGVVTIAGRDIDPFVVAGTGNFFPARGHGNRLP